MNDKMIRFIDSGYKELFTIPDGGRIKITYPGGDSRGTITRQCKFLDEYHTKIGNCVYHICQFAELMEHNGATYTPETDKDIEQRWEQYSPVTKDLALEMYDNGYEIYIDYDIVERRSQIENTTEDSLKSPNAQQYLDTMTAKVHEDIDKKRLEFREDKLYINAGSQKMQNVKISKNKGETR